MKHTIIILVFALFGLTNLNAQTDSCLNVINGALKGQSGNIQDNMFHNLMIDPNNPNIVYAGTETSGMFKTTDGGQTWQRLRLGLKCTVQQTGYPQIFNITADPTDASVVYASTVSGPGPVTGALYSSASAGVYKSIDNGLTWKQYNYGFTNSYNSFLSVNPTNSRELLSSVGGMHATQPSLNGAFFKGGLYKSINAANSWVKLNTPILADSNACWGLKYSQLPQLSIYSSWHTHDAGIPSLGLIKSIDNGNSWSVKNPPGIILGYFDVYKKNGNYIIGTSNVAPHAAYASKDGGISWQALGKSFFGEFKIHPTDSSIVFYLGGGKNISRTTNGFQSVQTVYTDNSLSDIPPRQYIQDIKISESNPNIVWACAQGYFLYKSIDGGSSFTKITAIRDLIYSTPTGIENLNNELSFSIYPNPANNTISIESNFDFVNAEINFYNYLGQSVKNISGINSKNTIVSLSELSNGMYFVILTNMSQKFIKKIIVHRE